MMQLVETNWPILLAAFAIGLLVAWLVWRTTRRTTVKRDPAEAGDTGVRRNQALIDAPPVAANDASVAAPGAVGGAAVAAHATGDRTDRDLPALEGEERAEAAHDASHHAPPHDGAAQPAPEDVEEAETLSQAANTDEIATAGETADAEAGAGVPAREAMRQVPAGMADRPAGGGEDDDLTRIKGVGPKLAAMLKEQGVFRFEQIARWSEEDVDRIDAHLGRFQGRIRRDDWRKQADLLASGDTQGYEAAFGRL